MESMDFMIAQCFALTGAISWTVTDQTRPTGGTVTLLSAGVTAYYRVYLANSAGAGTNASPYDLMQKIQALLGANWTTTLTTQGFVKFTYLGTGTGGFTLPATLAQILGFGGASTIGPLATGGSATAGFQPTHCIFSFNFANDSGWTRKRPRVAVATLPVTGETYGLSDRSAGGRRTFQLQYHPKNQTVRTAWNTANPGDPMLGTNMYPPDARYMNSWTSEPAQSVPWSVVDTFNIALDQSLGVAFGNLQSIIAGTGDTAFDVCYFTADCLQSGGVPEPSQSNWDARWNFSQIELSLYAKGVTR